MDPDETETWRRALARFREKKDGFFRSGQGSPLAQADRASFKGLKYFYPEPSFRFEVGLQRYSETEGLIMTTSKGTRQLFNKVGSFEFVINGESVRLQAYQSAEREDPSIFIPFRDATSGKESYGAARYLDLEVEHDDQYVVDFNYAYNPYCAYSEDFVCPLPPRDNWLTVSIRAGERKYHD
jgi:uncharacterized protein (DUF1684 family)